MLSNIDNVSSAELSKQKSSYNGKPVLLKINTDNNCYGVVLETFPKNNPIISTAFTDEEQNIDNWIKNEAVSSGTKTSFLNIRLNNIIANVQPNYKSKIIQNNQLDYKKQVDERLMNEFDMTSAEIETNVKADIQNILQQYDVSEDEFNLEDIRVYGSYTTGKNKDTSDLDLIVQYSGSMREDDAFNMFHDEGLTITDKNGVERVVDINPINRATSGTIDEHLGESYYQAAYHGSPHKFDTFSTDNIGTGEGAQAHGWGLYFAGKRDVSERYRRNLTQSVEDIIYNGKKLDINSNEYETIRAIWNFIDSKNDTFEKAQKAYIENYENYTQSEYETIRNFAEEKLKIAQSIDPKKIKYNGKGQLFEVDIPENDVLLDEDKELIHQPDKVQRAIEKIYADAMKSNNVELTNAIGITGKEIYRGFSKYFGSDKKASEFLNSYGIKGITYDGRQDGRCYVIFDDKAINVLQTYYQSMIQGIDGKQKVDVVDLTRAFPTDSTLTKKELSDYIKDLIDTQPISSSDKKALFSFIKRSKRVGKPNVYVPDHIAGSSKVENKYKGERNTAVHNISELLQNSVLIDIDKNRDTKGKPKVDNYLRFYVPVKIGDSIYTVRITTENSNKKNVFNILNADVYDVIIDKKMPTHSTLKNNSSSSLIESASNNNIPQNDKKITGVNKTDKITIEDMLRGVEDPDGKLYFQDEQGNFFRNGVEGGQNFNPDTINTLYKGEYVPFNRVIKIFESGDESTIIHEFAHWYLDMLDKYSDENEEVAQHIQVEE